MIFTIILLIGIHFVLPLYVFYMLWRSQNGSQFGWLLKVLFGVAFMGYLFIFGRWDWFSIYLRYLYIAIYFGLVILSYRNVRERPFFADDEGSFLRRYGWPILEVVLFTGLLAYTVSGLFYGEEPVRLAFPLKDGRYYVAQGGGSPLLNAHNLISAQEYAVDITELNPVGIRTEGIYPSILDRYVIYGETIYSPCDGNVVAAVDGLPDKNPPEADSENLAGNHVVIDCKDVHVLLAHMKNGSVMVQEGETVTTGQSLGQVGNTGNTTEPHLHIHAVKEGAEDILAEGDGVPILFAGRFPVRNSIFERVES